MKSQYISFLSILFLITACSSSISTAIVEPTASTTLISNTAVVQTIATRTKTTNKIVLLDFAISPDGKKLAVYLNTGVYLYDVQTSKRTAFYEFESDEYYSDLNASATIYPPFGAPGALAFSPDGSKIAISGKFQDEYISIWDLKTHEIIDYITNYPNGNLVRELEYSPKGDTLLIRSTYPKSRLQCPEQGEYIVN
jgi:WD40 repeat protein